jgi:hypothetical protein
MKFKEPIAPATEETTKIRPEKMVELVVERGYEKFLPQNFKDDPTRYFEEFGQKVKPGEKITYNEKGDIMENPDSVKDFPVWQGLEGKELWTVCKKINKNRGETKKSHDPFYEYKVLELLQELSLPAAKPIAKVRQNESCFMVTEKIPGIRWSERDLLRSKDLGFSEDDFKNLEVQANELLAELKEVFARAGIIRQPVMELGMSGWELKDMVFIIDLENKKVLKIIPTDWEMTAIDWNKVEIYKRKQL